MAGLMQAAARDPSSRPTWTVNENGDKVDKFDIFHCDSRQHPSQFYPRLLRVDFAMKEHSLCLLNKMQLSIYGSTSSPFIFNNALPSATAARLCPNNQKISRPIVSNIICGRVRMHACLVDHIQGYRCPNSQTHLSEAK